MGKHLEDMATKALAPCIEEMFTILWDNYLTYDGPCYTPLEVEEAQEQVGNLNHHRWWVTTDQWLLSPSTEKCLNPSTKCSSWRETLAYSNVCREGIIRKHNPDGLVM